MAFFTDPTTRQFQAIFFGFVWSSLISFKPSEPFFVEYGAEALAGGRLTVIEQVLPVFAYASAAAAACVALLALATDGGVRSARPVVMCALLAGACTSVLWAVIPANLPAMQASQVLVAFAFVGHVVMRAHLFRFVPVVGFRRLAGLLRAGFLVGTLSSAVLGQLLVSFAGTPVAALFWVAAMCQVVGLCLTFVLPRRPPPAQPSVKTKLAGGRRLPRPPAVSSSHDARSLLLDPAAADDGSEDTDIDGADGSRPLAGGDALAAVGRAKRHARTSAVFYVCWSSVAVGVHTLVITYWQGLFVGSSQPTGFALAAAYSGAVLATAAPAFGPLDRFARRTGVWLLVALAVLASASLHGLSWAGRQDLERAHALSNEPQSTSPAAIASPWLYVFFVAYHSLFELFTVLVHAKIGALLVEVSSSSAVSLPTADSLSSSLPSSSSSAPPSSLSSTWDGPEVTPVPPPPDCAPVSSLSVPHSGFKNGPSSDVPADRWLAPASRDAVPVVGHPRFTSVFSLNAALAVGCQIILQTVVSQSTLFNGHLPDQFLFFAIILYVITGLFVLAQTVLCAGPLCASKLE